MKYTLTTIVICLSVLNFSAHATDFSQARQNFSGFNLSVGGVYNITTFQVATQVNQNNITDTDYTGTVALSKNQAQTYVALGYGYVAPNNYYFAVNAFMDVGTVQNNTVAVGYTYSGSNMFASTFDSKLQNVFGLEFQPGYAFGNNDLFYMNLGAVGANVINAITAVSSDTVSTPLTGSITTTQVGFIAGFGYKHSIASTLGLLVELNYLQLAQFSQTITVPGANGYAETFTQNPYVGQLVIGVSF